VEEGLRALPKKIIRRAAPHLLETVQPAVL
jgi:hypothetical protein